ncbi:hypothetical protein GCM10011316_28890 [Roseibium aquae]|uniref:Uncharacterized protein n=2 Tax=Roseibium aquae TaxID=1323746 RepID=A0A916TNX3_9HYPH|nr:hypothetical protein GCM10011316_28890 [Roseibium aquae]
MATALRAQESTLILQELDLSVGGGEQVNGGDFGIILDFEKKAHDDGSVSVREIIPLVFQAKRYRRPNADISQRSSGTTQQRTLLQRNACTSAYIFYENATGKILSPLPVLVKAAAAVGDSNSTNVLADSLDLATFLLVALGDQTYAERALSPKNALNMIYDRAKFDELAALMVVSSDGTVGPRYQKDYEDVLSERSKDSSPDTDEYDPPRFD